MAKRPSTTTAAAIFMTAALLCACGATASKTTPSKAYLAACTQLNKQGPEKTAPPTGGFYVYRTAPRLQSALQHSGSPTLKKIGSDLSAANSVTDTKLFNSELDRGKSLCHSQQ